MILNEKEKIQVLEKESAADKKTSETVDKKSKDQSQEMENTDTNTSPEKKRKFVWRRREKRFVMSYFICYYQNNRFSRLLELAGIDII